MQVPEQEDQRGSREGKGRTRVADNKTALKKKPTGGRDRHPGGVWTAFCHSGDCSGYANFRCPDCKKPLCNGCAREWSDLSEGGIEGGPLTRMICQNCWDDL